MGPQSPLEPRLHVAVEEALVDLVHADESHEGVDALRGARVGLQVDVAGAGAAHEGQQQRDAVDLDLAATKPHGFRAPPRLREKIVRRPVPDVDVGDGRADVSPRCGGGARPRPGRQRARRPEAHGQDAAFLDAVKDCVAQPR